MTKRFSSDRILFGTTLALVFLGLLMVYSSSAAVAVDRDGSAAAIFLRQLAWAVLGLGALWLFLRGRRGLGNIDRMSRRI